MLKDRIIQLRKSKGLTQQKFAAAIHVTQAAVSQWETGRTTPDVQQLFIIADYFGVTVEELKNEDMHIEIPTTEKAPTDASVDRGIELFRQLSDENKAQVMQYMEFLRQKQ